MDSQVIRALLDKWKKETDNLSGETRNVDDKEGNAKKDGIIVGRMVCAQQLTSLIDLLGD
jgi:hypothetical protein